MSARQVTPEEMRAGAEPAEPGGLTWYPEDPLPKTSTVSAQDFLRELRAELVARLAKKTGWGRNDVMQEYDQAVAATLARRVRLV